MADHGHRDRAVMGRGERTRRRTRSHALWALALAAAMLLVVVGSVDAQVKQCNEDVQLVFHNPDLRPREDGKIYSSGRFFVQFQALGPRAPEVDHLLFSFGKNMPSEDMERCEPEQYPLTGAYLLGYRAAEDPESGFFIPINTTLVADGEVYASVTAYDADGNYLAHGWSKSVVTNGCAIPCGAALRAGLVTEEEVRANDKIMPWPWILPGDGAQEHDVGGLTIEFAEAIAEIRAWVQLPGAAGPREITDELEDWTPPERPDDLAPYPHSGSVSTRVWGDGFHWPDDVPDDSVVTVRAVDLNGNEAEKIVHVGSPTAGGIVTVETPEIRMHAPIAQKGAAPGETATFQVFLQNVGEGDAHVDLHATPPEGGNVTAAVSPHHVSIPSGEDAVADLEVRTTADTPKGRYATTVDVEYHTGVDVETRELVVTLVVGGASGARDVNVVDPGADEDVAANAGNATGGRGVPAPGSALVGALAVLAARAVRALRAPAARASSG